MTRLFKFFIRLILALLAVGLTFVIIFLMVPSWQKATVEKILARDTARKWQVESIQLGPTGVEATGVMMLDGPVGAEVNIARLEGPFWKIPFNGRIEISSGEVAGFFVDVSQIRVGDLTSEDWQSFLETVSSDADFWEERVGLILQKLSASGYNLYLRNLSIRGDVLMPGQRLIPISIYIIEADSEKASKVNIRTLEEPPLPEL